MMEETTTTTFKSFNVNSKRLYRKHKDPPNHSTKVDLQNPIDSFTNQFSLQDSTTTNSTDWHRLLLTRLKPHVTGKYRTTRKDGYKLDPYVSALI